MSSSIASSLLCRTLRLSFSSLNLRQHRRPLFYSSIASRPSSPLTRRAIITRSLEKPSSHLSLRFASSKLRGADENLKRVIDSEIDCAMQEGGQDQEVALPDGFPFEIIDNPGDQTITLKREFAGENFQVTVFPNADGEGDLEDDEDESGKDNTESSIQPSFSLVVMIDKGDGPVLEISCNLNADELAIENMIMKKHDDPDDQGSYQGPEYSDLDENLQKALHKYLEVRGIEGSLFDFLQEYMINKDDREYLTWLKSMKKFIEK